MYNKQWVAMNVVMERIFIDVLIKDGEEQSSVSLWFHGDSLNPWKWTSVLMTKWQSLFLIRPFMVWLELYRLR